MGLTWWGSASKTCSPLLALTTCDNVTNNKLFGTQINCKLFRNQPLNLLFWPRLPLEIQLRLTGGLHTLSTHTEQWATPPLHTDQNCATHDAPMGDWDGTQTGLAAVLFMVSRDLCSANTNYANHRNHNRRRTPQHNGVFWNTDCQSFLLTQTSSEETWA